jgi:hypothetical protein
VSVSERLLLPAMFLVALEINSVVNSIGRIHNGSSVDTSAWANLGQPRALIAWEQGAETWKPRFSGALIGGDSTRESTENLQSTPERIQSSGFFGYIEIRYISFIGRRGTSVTPQRHKERCSASKHIKSAKG